MVEELADRAAIGDLLLRYFRAMDRHDMDLARACFADEARLSYGDAFDGDPNAFVAWVSSPEVLGGVERTMHFAGNTLIEFDGDVAYSEVYALAQHTAKAGHRWEGAFVTMWLRYIDRLERRDDGWRIVHREAITEWVRKDTAGMWEEVDSSSRRDRQDPVYR